MIIQDATLYHALYHALYISALYQRDPISALYQRAISAYVSAYPRYIRAISARKINFFDVKMNLRRESHEILLRIQISPAMHQAMHGHPTENSVFLCDVLALRKSSFAAMPRNQIREPLIYEHPYQYR